MLHVSAYLSVILIAIARRKSPRVVLEPQTWFLMGPSRRERI
jgi:hypothetical protein